MSLRKTAFVEWSGGVDGIAERPENAAGRAHDNEKRKAVSAIMGRSCWIPALAVAIVLVATDCGRAEQFRDADRHFTLEVPDGWEVIPKDALVVANAAGPDWLRAYAISYSGGLQRQSDKRTGSPMILIQFEPVQLQGKSLEDVEHKWA